MTSQTLLRGESLRKTFGGLIALKEVSFGVKRGSIKSIVGPNGAGKTTLFNLLTGLDIPTAGRVFSSGQDITDWPADRRATVARMGRTFQNARLFRSLTVLENAMVGRHSRSNSGLLASILKTPGTLREERDIKEKALDVLKFVGLSEKPHEMAGSLAYGGQRRLEIARALATEPEILLLDEPAAGLNEAEMVDLRALVLALRDAGVTILLIEHQMRLVMDVSDEIMVLNFGEMLAEGTPAAIQADQTVKEAYLGG